MLQPVPAGGRISTDSRARFSKCNKRIFDRRRKAIEKRPQVDSDPSLLGESGLDRYLENAQVAQQFIIEDAVLI